MWRYSSSRSLARGALEHETSCKEGTYWHFHLTARDQYAGGAKGGYGSERCNS